MRALILAAAVVVSSSANAANVYIDEFTIIKNDNIIFQDTFSNGVPPEDNGGNRQSYKVFGGPLGAETGGKLALDARQGVLMNRPGDVQLIRQGARVNTNTDIATPNKGLRTDDTFSITGLFDLTDLFGVSEWYGVRLTDVGSNYWNDTLGLSVMRTSETQLDVVFHSFDRNAFTFNILEAITVDLEHEQIALMLSRNNLNTGAINASFAYVDAGVTGTFTEFAATDSIFLGEDFTRGAYMYVAPVPVPAAAWLFGTGLIGLVGVARRKSRG